MQAGTYSVRNYRIRIVRLECSARFLSILRASRPERVEVQIIPTCSRTSFSPFPRRQESFLAVKAFESARQTTSGGSRSHTMWIPRQKTHSLPLPAIFHGGAGTTLDLSSSPPPAARVGRSYLPRPASIALAPETPPRARPVHAPAALYGRTDTGRVRVHLRFVMLTRFRTMKVAIGALR